MTRLAILTDIHANMPALQAVIEHMQTFAPDQVVVAGDLINGTPFNRAVLETVYARRWAFIRGNHEFYYLNTVNGRRPSFPEEGQYQWLYNDIPDWYNIIAAMPDTLQLVYPDAPPIRVWHGLPHDNMKAFDTETPLETIEDTLLQSGVMESTYICGHYHIGFERHTEHYHVINPGSVGLPQDGIRKASYVILDSDTQGWHATYHRVPYDFSRIERGFHEHELFSAWGINGRLSYETLKQARWIINSFYAWFRETYPDAESATEVDVETYLGLGLDGMWQYFKPAYRVNRHRDLIP